MLDTFKSSFTRLLFTGIGQVLLIILWMQFPGQEAAGYLLLLLLLGIPVGAISNALIKKLIVYVMDLTDSKILKYSLPFLIIVGSFLILVLLIWLLPFLYLVLFYIILSLPLLIFEMIFYLYKESKVEWWIQKVTGVNESFFIWLLRMLLIGIPQVASI